VGLRAFFHHDLSDDGNHWLFIEHQLNSTNDVKHQVTFCIAPEFPTSFYAMMEAVSKYTEVKYLNNYTT
jgi:hypothetical protein